MDPVTLAGFGLTIGSTLLAVGISYGRTQEGIRNIIRRLDILNGSQLSQDVKLQEHGERLSRLEGKEER